MRFLCICNMCFGNCGFLWANGKNVSCCSGWDKVWNWPFPISLSVFSCSLLLLFLHIYQDCCFFVNYHFNLHFCVFFKYALFTIVIVILIVLDLCCKMCLPSFYFLLAYGIILEVNFCKHYIIMSFKKLPCLLLSIILTTYI